MDFYLSRVSKYNTCCNYILNCILYILNCILYTLHCMIQFTLLLYILHCMIHLTYYTCHTTYKILHCIIISIKSRNCVRVHLDISPCFVSYLHDKLWSRTILRMHQEIQNTCFLIKDYSLPCKKYFIGIMDC